MIASFATSKGLNALDTKFNVSGVKSSSSSVRINDEGSKTTGNIGNPSENPKVLKDAYEDSSQFMAIGQEKMVLWHLRQMLIGVILKQLQNIELTEWIII